MSGPTLQSQPAYLIVHADQVLFHADRAVFHLFLAFFQLSPSFFESAYVFLNDVNGPDQLRRLV